MSTQEKVKKSPLKETEREELERLREENEFLRLSIEYRKKLNALVLERERKTKIILKLSLKYLQVMLKTWLKISGLAKSLYYEWKEKLSKSSDQAEVLIQKIFQIVEDSKGRYGYRRVTMVLQNKGLKVHHKRVCRLMKSEGLLCRKYSSYKGTVGKVVQNILNRNFDVKKPNKVWVTDVTEFKVSNKKLYLSTILDLYNSEIISFSLSSNPNINFTNDSLKKALDQDREIEGLVIHSDQGFHYQH